MGSMFHGTITTICIHVSIRVSVPARSEMCRIFFFFGIPKKASLVHGMYVYGTVRLLVPCKCECENTFFYDEWICLKCNKNSMYNKKFICEKSRKISPSTWYRIRIRIRCQRIGSQWSNRKTKQKPKK